MGTGSRVIDAYQLLQACICHDVLLLIFSMQRLVFHVEIQKRICHRVAFICSFYSRHYLGHLVRVCLYFVIAVANEDILCQSCMQPCTRLIKQRTLGEALSTIAHTFLNDQ